MRGGGKGAKKCEKFWLYGFSYYLLYVLGLSRGYEAGLRELLAKGGFSVIINHCLCSGIRKVTIKALFMISSFYTSETSKEAQGMTLY